MEPLFPMPIGQIKNNNGIAVYDYKKLADYYRPNVVGHSYNKNKIAARLYSLFAEDVTRWSIRFAIGEVNRSHGYTEVTFFVCGRDEFELKVETIASYTVINFPDKSMAPDVLIYYPAK